MHLEIDCRVFLPLGLYNGMFSYQLQTQPFNCADKSYKQAEVWFHFSPWFFWFCNQCRASAPHPRSFPELPDGCRTWSHLRVAPQNRHWPTRFHPSLNTTSFFHHSQTHFHPWLELELYKTNSKHFTDAQVACLPLTPGFSYGSTSPMPLPLTRAGLIRIYTGKTEHIIWALYRRLTVRR